MEELVQKIKDIYLRYGIKSVTMDDLSHELGISKKTLYEHFADKEDVVNQVVSHIINSQSDCLRNILTNDETNAIDELFQMSQFIAEHSKSVNPSFSYDLRKYYPQSWDELSQFNVTTVFEHILANMQRGVREGLYSEDLNHEIIAWVYVSRLEINLPGNLPEPGKYSFQEVFRTLFRYHIMGIANDNGRKYLEKLLSNNEPDNLR